MKKTESQIDKKKIPVVGMLSIIFLISGNIVAYGLLLSSQDGPSDLAGGMIGMLIGLGTWCISPILALCSLLRIERPTIYALATLLLELIIVSCFIIYAI